ncbi:MAG TPA: head-tail adaptor protein, partial [Allosphingosinicella sp.]
TRPARIRIRFREDVTADMRFVLGSRVMQIVAGPAEATDLEPRQAVDFMVEDYRPAGNPA